MPQERERKGPTGSAHVVSAGERHSIKKERKRERDEEPLGARHTRPDVKNEDHLGCGEPTKGWANKYRKLTYVRGSGEGSSRMNGNWNWCPVFRRFLCFRCAAAPK
eukprot:6344223-Prymnesium_polylepis.1